MKKNMMTIVLIALAVVNVTLSAVLVFVVVPSATRTNNLVTKVMQILDLELESVEPTPELTVEDIAVYKMADNLIVNLAKSPGDTKNHYASFPVSLSENKKADDYATMSALVPEYEDIIKEIITEEFANYTIDSVSANKDVIKKEVIKRISELMNSDFIVNISFGNIILE